MVKITRKPPAIAEIVFDSAYLLFAAGAGIWMLTRATSTAATLYGVLALTLCFGDAFHLVPRIYSLWTDTMEQHKRALSFGKLMTSITMTIFYVMLYGVWKLLFGSSAPSVFTWLVVGLAAVRILLCLMPQNGWFAKQPSARFAVYRNIPFTLLGGLIIYLFALQSNNNFRFMPMAITLSFGFYLAVVLFVDRYPKAGMLMLPKTCAYVWMLCMGFSLLPA